MNPVTAFRITLLGIQIALMGFMGFTLFRLFYVNKETDKEFKKAMDDYKQLITPTPYACDICGQRVLGEIPFKMHSEKCLAYAQKQLTPTGQPKPKPDKALGRMLRDKLLPP